MDRTTQRRPNRRPSNQWNLTGILIIVICVLVVILAVIVGIAIATHHPQDVGTTDPITQTESTEQTDISEYIGLQVGTSIENGSVTVEKAISFTGTSDPAFPVTVNGQEIARQADGTFTYTAELTAGINEFLFSHKEETFNHCVEYRYAVQQYSPSEKTEYNCGATIQLSLTVRDGSELKVTLDGKTITMKESVDQVGIGVAEGFTLYTGTYKLPNSNTSDLDLGPIQYTVTCNGVTETYTSGNIICKKSASVLASNPGVTPDYGEYIDVGSGYIVEIINTTAETFNGKTNDDKSNPLRNYLPKGTVDYGSTTLVKNGSLSYRLLRCGRRVYTESKNTPLASKTKVVDCYMGTLPDHNEVTVSSLKQVDHFTMLTLDVLWKAPFYLDIAPQTYNDPDARDFRITDLTVTYVDITFCYATVFEGDITVPADNPLFKSAELIKRESDCTLRLHLKKTGGFYGWDAYYNDQDQLCFRFLNPIKVTTSDNFYGADLTGLRVMIDVGHGGFDCGAVGKDSSGNQIEEADRNLALALVLKQELESAGATVIMNRETDIRLSVSERLTFLKDQAPDICICIHHNSLDAQYAYYNGCEVSYFTPQSQAVANLINEHTKQSGAYNSSKLMWYYYFVSRMSNCPIVLMENGYISNVEEATKMSDPAVLLAKAQAMVKGIAQYYLGMS